MLISEKYTPSFVTNNTFTRWNYYTVMWMNEPKQHILSGIKLLCLILAEKKSGKNEYILHNYNFVNLETDKRTQSVRSHANDLPEGQQGTKGTLLLLPLPVDHVGGPRLQTLTKQDFTVHIMPCVPLTHAHSKSLHHAFAPHMYVLFTHTNWRFAQCICIVLLHYASHIYTESLQNAYALCIYVILHYTCNKSIYKTKQWPQ